jgi:hypothetical protein
LFAWTAVAFHVTEYVIAPVAQSAANCLECITIYAIEYIIHITSSGSGMFTVRELEEACSIAEIPNQQVT